MVGSSVEGEGVNKTCYIMVGVSGSGKSTFVDKLLVLHPFARVFSLDQVRVSMYEASLSENQINELNFENDKDVYSKAFEYVNANQKEFDAQVNAAWAYALKGEVVIVDNTNLTRKARARWIQEARSKGFTIVAVNVMAPLQVVIDRQASRKDKSVPPHVVRDMYMRQQEVQADEAEFILHADGVRGGNLVGNFHLA